MKRTLFAFLLLGGLSGCAEPELPGWPGWRGPAQDGTHPATGLFAEGFRLERDWITPLGSGYSAVSVSSGTAVTIYSDGRLDLLVALRAADGEPRWSLALGPTRKGESGAADGPLSTPLIHGSVVYALSARGRLVAARLDDGEVLWSLPIDEELGARPWPHGFATTPLVAGGALIVQTGADGDRSTCALDPQTGRLIWSHGSEPVGYQSPLLVERAGRTDLLITDNRATRALDPRTGSERWSHPHPSEVPDGHTQVVPIGADRLLIHYINGSMLYRMGNAPEELWRSTALRPSLNPPLYHDGYLYGFRGESLVCLDAATGEAVWESDEPTARSAILVDGHLLVFSLEGELVVVEATPAGYTERARIETALKDSYTWPSFAGGRVFLRDLEGVAAIRIVSPGS